MKRRLVVLLAVLGLVCLTGATGAGAAAEPPPNRQYRVQGPADAQQRSAVASTGAAIDEVTRDSVLVTATEAEAEAIARLGFRVTELPRPIPPSAVGTFDFPPADSRYHNYAEMNANIDALVAARPTIAGKFVGEGWHLSLGLLFVLIVVFLPGGIMEGARRIGAWFGRPRNGSRVGRQRELSPTAAE